MASVTEQKTMGVIERLNKGTSVSCCVPSGRGGGTMVPEPPVNTEHVI